MSGLAEILMSFNCRVSGSDLKESDITRKLRNMGADIFIGHREENVKGADLVVYTAAIKEDNPELVYARKHGIEIISRATLLGAIFERYKYGIAVSGTHGKTTTTSIISLILLESGKDPTIHIGGELEVIGGTTRAGKSGYLVAEACEYYGSFLSFKPYVAVILNVEFDHADYFRDIGHVRNTFREFAALVPPDGYVVYNADDEYIAKFLNGIRCNKVTFGLNNPAADYSARNISYDEFGCASFMLVKNGKDVVPVHLKVPGIHNVMNSLAAFAACSIVGCDAERIAGSLGSFTGTHRRFEFKGTVDGIKVIDDYAHHPSEIKATLKAARSNAQNGIWCVFQPHTYTRTKYLLQEFAGAFSDADHVIVTDIYAAREPDTGEINSQMLADKINDAGGNAIYIKEFEDIAFYLAENVKPGQMIITMGAGDVYEVADLFFEKKRIKLSPARSLQI
jgi:UDP-N-acetylmuramate--alanine ligase